MAKNDSGSSDIKPVWKDDLPVGRDDVEAIAQKNGFELIESKGLSEIDGSAHVMRHSGTGARLLYLRNDDPDKSFSISFKTPAADDTGVFHILEHSVLCGSERFPVKEPFVNLLKSSMQTFLNAMTFPDKTMYPVASTNEQDLMNLMEVYLDAVFYPNIYTNPNIFAQEGWHLEFESSDDDASSMVSDGEEGKGKLVYNGVVFNEMKGALSDPDSVLFDLLCAALFPDTTYRFESGGTPESIPTLTYEAFIDDHKRHYRADNCYIVLYGDLDLGRFLEYIDTQYLTPFAQDPTYSMLPSVNESGQQPIKMHPNPLDIQSPVVSRGSKKKMNTTPDNSCLAMGFVIGEAKDKERVMATDILMDAIAGSNVSPLKRALLDAGIADDISVQVVDSMAQPFVMIEAKGLKEGAEDAFEPKIREEIGKLATGGLDIDLVEAALSHAEFIMREHNFGYPDGILYAMSALSGWLYDEEMPLGYIEFEDVYTALRNKLGSGFFEGLLREIFIDSDHFALVEVEPVQDPLPDENAIRLEALSTTLDDREIEDIEGNIEELRNAQNAPDAPEDIAKLPKLEISDIGEAPNESEWEESTVDGRVVLVHHVDTRGIAYFFRYYDLGVLDFEELPYASILALVLGKLDTEQHTAEDLDTLIQSRLGSLNFSVEAYESGDRKRTFVPLFSVNTSALSENARYCSELGEEILYTSDFEQKDKIFNILMQTKIALEQKFAMAGNSVAANRAYSYYSKVGLVRESISGIDFYIFLKDLLANFDARFPSLSEKLIEVSKRLYEPRNYILSFGGSDKDLEEYKKHSNDGARIDDHVGVDLQEGRSTDYLTRERAIQPSDSGKLSVPEPNARREAFIVPSDVTFSAMSTDMRDIDARFSGAWLVTSKVLTLDYLWNAVRVVGGAYGVGFSASRQGFALYTSYRDPHVDETIDRFKDSGKWLSKYDPTDDVFKGFIVSTASTFDKPLKPKSLIKRQDSMYFSNYSEAERLGFRQQVIDTKLEDVVGLCSKVDELNKSDHICCVGNREIIEKSNLDFDMIDLFAINQLPN